MSVKVTTVFPVIKPLLFQSCATGDGIAELYEAEWPLHGACQARRTPNADKNIRKVIGRAAVGN
jgi:hypothetical protein